MRYGADWVFPASGAPVKNGYVEFSGDGTIISVGEGHEGCSQIFEGAIVPGFVNSHCHIELSHLVDLFDEGTGMDGFIQQINVKRCTVDLEGRLAAMTAEMDKLYRQGVSAMADISNCSESFCLKALSPIYTRTFLEVFGTEPEDVPEVMLRILHIQEKAKEIGIDAAPTPHSCYTMSPLLNRTASAAGLRGDGFISYHSQESMEEDAMIRRGCGPLWDDYTTRPQSVPPVTGTSSLVYFIDNLKKEMGEEPIEGHVILVHNVATDDEIIEYSLSYFKNVYWAICPLSNIFIHRQLPDINLLKKHNLNICIGTDSLSSNHKLHIVSEMRCLQENFPELTLEELIRWASYNGACALGKESIFGSLESGKKPGIVLISNIEGESADDLRLTAASESTRLI